MRWQGGELDEACVTPYRRVRIAAEKQNRSIRFLRTVLEDQNSKMTFDYCWQSHAK